MNWIPAVTTSFLLGVVLFFMRHWIVARLTQSIKNEYDTEIEKLKAELTAKQSQIDALRGGALSGVVNRQVTLYNRQILAVEQLWDGIISLSHAKHISAWMSVMNYPVALEESAKNEQFRAMFKSMFSSFDVNKLNTTIALKSRPFVSPLAWALYLAYQTIIFYAVYKFESLKSGIGKDYSDKNMITNIVTIALPHQIDFIKQFGPDGFHYLLDDLESSLLKELTSILNGEQSDKESLERAALIIKESEKLINSFDRNASTIPDSLNKFMRKS